MKWINDERGSALMYVIVVMSVVFLLVAGVITVSMSENKQVMYQSDYMNAYYIARAGAESMALEILTMPIEDLGEFSAEKTATASNILKGVGDVSVAVVSSGDEYRIMSTGTYNALEVIVEIIMEYSDAFVFNYAAYSIEDMGAPSPDLIGIGPVYGNLASKGTVYVKSGDIGDNTTVINGASNPIVIEEPIIDESLITQLTTYSGGDLSLSSSTRIDGLTMGKNDTLEINTSAGDFAREYFDVDTDGDIDASDELYFRMTPSTDAGWMIIYLTGETVIGEVEIDGSNNCMIVVDDRANFLNGIEIKGTGYVEIHCIDDIASDVDGSPDTEYDYELELEGNVLYGDSDVNTIKPKFDKDATPADFTGIDPDLLTIYVHGDEGANADDMNTLYLNGNINLYGYIFAPEGTILSKNGSTNLFGGMYGLSVDFQAEPSIVQAADYTSSHTLYKAMQIDRWE